MDGSSEGSLPLKGEMKAEIPPFIDLREDEEADSKQANITYQTITHSDRLKIVYAHKVLQLTKSEVSKLYKINYSSVQKIIKSFEQDGRTNKKQYIDLPYLSMIDTKSGGPSLNSK